MKLFLAILITFVIGTANLFAGELKPWKGGDTPPIMLLDTKGKTHNLAQYKGRVVLVNFWATWCVPCRKEMPSMQSLKDKLATKPFDILAVDMAESEAAVTSFLKKIGVNFTVLLDKEGKTVKQWNILGFPSSFIVDSTGKIRYTIVGELVWDDPKVIEQISTLFP